MSWFGDIDEVMDGAVGLLLLVICSPLLLVLLVFTAPFILCMRLVRWIRK